MLHKKFCLSVAVLAVALCGGSSAAGASPIETGFLKREVQVGGKPRGYRVYVPPNFDPNKKYPVVLFLHGSKQWGEDNEGHLLFGLPAVMRVGARLRPGMYNSFIGVFPQSRVETPWVGEMADYAIEALDRAVAEFKADPRRLYVTGFSLGGYGSWYVAAKHPGKFAAVAPIGGNVGVPERMIPLVKALVPPDMAVLYLAPDPYAAFARLMGKTPVWIFHGGEDRAVPVADSRRAHAALRAAGGNVRYTEYAGEGHFIFERTYTDPQFWSWLLAQRSAR